MAFPATASSVRVNPRDRSLRDYVPWLLAALYAVALFVLGVVRYNGHRNFVDLGIFAQTAASAFGCFCNTVEGSHWAVHFSPILYVAGALMLVWRSALALVALQGVAGALAIPPIYGIVARRASRPTARLCALVAFLYPPLAGLIFNDFHENGFAPAAVAWMLWAFDGGLTVIVILAAVITLAIKEDQGIFLAIAGALGWWRFRGTSAGRICALIGFAGAVVFVDFFRHIQPHAALHSHWMPVRFYAWTQNDVRALFPRGILDRAGFVLLTFLPLLFLPFRSRFMWLAAAPLAEVLLSRMSTTYTVGSHYAGAWAGYVLVAFAVALRRIPERRARLLLGWCIALCVAEFAAADPLHPRLTLHAPGVADRSLDAFLKTLAVNASVASQEEAFTHLAATDPNATVLPELAGASIRACSILIDGDFPQSPRLVESSALVRRLVTGGAYRLQRSSGAISLYTSPRCR